MAGDNHVEDHDRGLSFDLTTLSRRRALTLLGAGLGTSMFALAGCSSKGSAAASGTGTTAAAGASPSAASSAASASNLTKVPEETAGPFPGDGSNGPDVLKSSGIVRSDIRSSFGSATTTAAGVPLTIALTVLDAANGGKPVAGAAIYVWHCDRDGNYSMYSSAAAKENYLRGVQPTGADGTATFTSIFPAAYSGRWPHIHFEIYDSLAVATASGTIKATSQIALPEATCNAVYATDGYSASVRNMKQTSLSSDNVFGNDSAIHQLATMTGGVGQGLKAALVVGV